MKCPQCQEPDLVMADRQGIEIDYCPNCRGVWLDRGELDKLIEKSVPPRPPSADRDYADRPPQRSSYESDHSYRGDYSKKKRKEGSLSELLDFCLRRGWAPLRR